MFVDDRSQSAVERPTEMADRPMNAPTSRFSTTERLTLPAAPDLLHLPKLLQMPTRCAGADHAQHRQGHC